MRKLSAFSLVELLVVIGIIAVLISMLMPALTRARQQALEVQCASQLRQVGNGLMGYASNNRGYYPGWSGWQVWGYYGTPKDGTGDDEAGPGWTEALIPYFTKDTKIYHCPAFPDEQTFDYFISAAWLHYKQSEAQPPDPNKTNLQVSDIKFPTKFILSGDCNQPSLYPGSSEPYRTDRTQQDCDHDDSTQKGVLFFGEDNYGRSMHIDGNNILFADNHVAPFKKFDPEQMTYDPRAPGVSWDDLQNKSYLP
jgi:prepilin-type processing-associated H-X9-DG protein